MTHPRVALILASLLIAPIAADAQMIVGPSQGPGPGAGPGPVMGTGPMPSGPGPGAGPPGAQNLPPCLANFLPLRNEAEKRAGVLQAGIKHKKPRPEICQLFKHFSEAEEKAVNYAAANMVPCGIPADAVASMKKNHAKTVDIRDKVCSADVGAAGPVGPNLGEALGTRGTLPNPETTRSGTGTLDTLSGNPLAR
jgi:hypothetical protein